MNAFLTKFKYAVKSQFNEKLHPTIGGGARSSNVADLVISLATGAFVFVFLFVALQEVLETQTASTGGWGTLNVFIVYFVPSVLGIIVIIAMLKALSGKR